MLCDGDFCRGAMSLTLALRYPQTFVAVASHSGAAPNSAGTLIQAGQTLRGGALPDVEELAQRLATNACRRCWCCTATPDLMVAPANGDAAVGLWLTLAAGHGKITSSSAELARGTRYPCTRSTGSSTASRLQAAAHPRSRPRLERRHRQPGFLRSARPGCLAHGLAIFRHLPRGEMTGFTHRASRTSPG